MAATIRTHGFVNKWHKPSDNHSITRHLTLISLTCEQLNVTSHGLSANFIGNMLDGFVYLVISVAVLLLHR